MAILTIMIKLTILWGKCVVFIFLRLLPQIMRQLRDAKGWEDKKLHISVPTPTKESGFFMESIIATPLKTATGARALDPYRTVASIYGKNDANLLYRHPEAMPLNIARADRLFYDWVRQSFALPETENPESFAREQFRTAHRFAGGMAQLLDGGYNNRLIPLNETANFPVHPDQILRDMISSTTDETLRFELQRQTTIAMIIGMDRAKDFLYETDAGLDEALNRYLSTRLWQGSYGERFRQRIYSLHDNQTNEVVAEIAHHPLDLPAVDGSHTKAVDIDLRFIKPGIFGSEQMPPVVQITRRKSSTSIITKSLDKGLREERDPLEVVTNIEDRGGAMFVILGDDKANQKFSRIVRNILGEGFEIQFIPDHASDQKTKNHRSPKFLRWKALITNRHGLPSTFELIFMTGKNYLNYTFDTGTYNPKTGRHDGIAHELFEAQRLMTPSGEEHDVVGVAEWMFPRERYFQGTNNSADMLLVRREKEIVARLKRAQRIRL